MKIIGKRLNIFIIRKFKISFNVVLEKLSESNQDYNSLLQDVDILSFMKYLVL